MIFETYRSYRLLAIFAAVAVIAFTALFTGSRPVSAQDGSQTDGPITGYVILGEETAGPHKVQVQVSPGKPVVGILRFAVRIRNAETGEDIDDAIVRIFGTPSEKGEKQYSPALNSPFDPIFYLAQLELEHAGIWAIDVEIESELGTGTTVMSLRVDPRIRGGSGGVWGTVLFGLIGLAFVGAGTWLWYSSKKARKSRTRAS